MEQQNDWEKISKRLERLMRLKSFPVAFKMLEKKEDLNEISFLRRAEHKVTLCQLISFARSFDRTMGADVDDFISPECSSILGLTHIPEVFRDGTSRSIVWTNTKESGKKYEESIVRLPLGKYEAVAMGPLVYGPFEPDIVLVYANPAQMMLLINSLQYEDYEVMQFYCVGESSCSDAVSRCYLTSRPSLTIPCYGERCFGHAQDEDLVMAIPAEMMEKALRGMEALYNKGIRYPIGFAGVEKDITSSFHLTSANIDELNIIRGTDNRLLIGITGGIASGKSTVSDMFKKLGVPHIDYDVIARQVVEPGKPAWKDILAYFGSQVLNKDKSVDRKKLGGIIFRDYEKRKKLESFTHPRIHKQFLEQLDEITKDNPGLIIQVSVPLMIEQNLQHMFHKLLVVYVSEEHQIERLIARDKINEEAARAILRAQSPIEEKIGYSDFVIYNSGSLDATKKQVADLLKQLQGLQKDAALRDAGK